MIENGGFATYRFEGMIGFKAGLVHLPRSGLLEPRAMPVRSYKVLPFRREMK